MNNDINVVGNYPILQRKSTGLFSLDWCLGSRGTFGAPLRSIYEIYGYPNSGKSTLCYYLAGALSPQPEITICDLENLDVEYLKSSVGTSGFKGTIRLVDAVDEKGGYRTHESMLTDMTLNLTGTSGAAILDSVGAIQPLAEATGDFGEAFMGKRAKLVAQVARSLSNTVRNGTEAKNAYIINHVHQIIGGRGHTTAGGVVLTFMAAVRIMIWGKEQFTVSETDDRPIGFLVEGKTEKLRFGGKGRVFSYYIVPGLGVHPGVSAMFDCFNYKLAERSTTVKMGGKSMGYLKKEFLSYAESGKTRKFDPFVEALQKYQDTELKWGLEEEDDLQSSKPAKSKRKEEVA
jgi:RecA/RadA recombinase